MFRVPIVIAQLALALLTTHALSAETSVGEGRLIDLTIEGAADSDAWAYRRLAGLYPCAAGDRYGSVVLGTVRAGVLILGRDHAHAQPSSKILSAADGSVLLDTADLGLGTSAGVDLAAVVPLSQALELEIRYFGITGWSTSQTVSDAAGVQFQGLGILMPAVETERVDYQSRLYNFEVNARPRVAGGMPLIVGLRTLQLHEHFGLWNLSPVPESPAIDTHTSNHLWGVQIGAEPYLLGGDGPLKLEGVLKAGIYNNHASQGSWSSLGPTALTASRNRVSFVGEAGLMVDYQFSRLLALRAGYELFWLTGVALAPDQGATTNFAGPSATLNCSSSALYQGASACLEFVF